MTLQKSLTALLFKNGLSILLLLPHAVWALNPYEATYSLYYHGVKAGTVTQTFKAETKDHYSFSNVVEPVLSILPYGGYERSIFKMAHNTIIPLRYDYKKQQGKIESGVILFDYKNKIAQEESTKHQGSLPITNETHDKQTYFLQFIADVAAGKKTFDYKIVGDGKTRKYHFNHLGNVTLNTHLGALKTIKFKQENEDKSRITYLWLDPSRQYLVVRLLQIRKGAIAGESTIESYQRLQ